MRKKKSRTSYDKAKKKKSQEDCDHFFKNHVKQYQPKYAPQILHISFLEIPESSLSSLAKVLQEEVHTPFNIFIPSPPHANDLESYLELNTTLSFFPQFKPNFENQYINTLYSMHKRYLIQRIKGYAFTRGWYVNQLEAQDIAIKTIENYWKYAYMKKNFQLCGERGYLDKIAIRLLIKEWRSKIDSGKTILQDRIQEEPGKRTQDRTLLKHIIEKSINLLPLKRRICFIAHEVNGELYSTIASDLGIKESTVRTHVELAKRELQKYLTLEIPVETVRKLGLPIRQNRP